MNSKRVVVDFEGFRYGKNEVVFKEIGVYGDFLDSLIFQPPYPIETQTNRVQKQYKWLTTNLHGIPWDSGTVPYNKVHNFVQSINLRYDDATFYAKGHEKTKWLSSLFQRQFYDLDALGCKIKPNDEGSCKFESSHHSTGIHCARRKALAYGLWIQSFDHGLPSDTVCQEL